MRAIIPGLSEGSHAQLDAPNSKIQNLREHDRWFKRKSSEIDLDDPLSDNQTGNYVKMMVSEELSGAFLKDPPPVHLTTR